MCFQNICESIPSNYKWHGKRALGSTAEGLGVGGLGEGSTLSVKFDFGAEGKPEPEITIT